MENEYLKNEYPKIIPLKMPYKKVPKSFNGLDIKKCPCCIIHQKYLAGLHQTAYCF